MNDHSKTEASNADSKSVSHEVSFRDLSLNLTMMSVTGSDSISGVMKKKTSLGSDFINNGEMEKESVGSDSIDGEVKKKTSLGDNGDKDGGGECEGSENGSSSLSSTSNYYCNSIDVNESSSLGSLTCQSKPHKGNDLRWDAIQSVKMGKEGGERERELGLGHFRLLKKLGFGDIGSVYLAELRGMGCLFAMKVMDKGMLDGRKKLARAQTEREILSLLDHPFLPTLYSHFETEKFSCLLMEFCSGGDLHILRQHQPAKHFQEQAARFYASEVLLALEYLHMMGVVYRDLKPENVLVREDGHIMLSDFDLSLQCFVSPTLVKSNMDSAPCTSSYCKLPVCVEPTCFRQPSCFKPRLFNSKLLASSKSKSKSKGGGGGGGEQIKMHMDSLPELVAEPTEARSMSFVGTHEYLAPEIIRGDGHGSSVDWWTFGIFLYELLYGKTPFKGNGNRETLFNVVGETLKFPPDDDGLIVSLAAKDLIKGLLSKDPQKRLGFKRGATEIKQHSFFQSINWALIRGNQPPEIPKPLELSSFKRTNKPETGVVVPSSDKVAASDSSDRSSGPYLDFEFF